MVRLPSQSGISTVFANLAHSIALDLPTNGSRVGLDAMGLCYTAKPQGELRRGAFMAKRCGLAVLVASLQRNNLQKRRIFDNKGLNFHSVAPPTIEYLTTNVGICI